MRTCSVFSHLSPLASLILHSSSSPSDKELWSMPEGGIEPPRPEGPRILSPVRLPGSATPAYEEAALRIHAAWIRIISKSSP